MYDLGTAWHESVDFDRLRSYRLGRLSAQLEKSSCEAILAFRPENVSYITGLRPMWSEYSGYLTRYAALYLPGQQPYLFVPEEEVPRCRAGMKWLSPDHVVALSRSFIVSEAPDVSVFTNLLSDLGAGAGTLAVDACDIGVYLGLKAKLPKARIVDGDYALKEAKMIKNDDEIKLLRMACAITDVGFDVAMREARPGMRECDLAAKIYAAQYKLGFERSQGTHIVASGGPMGSRNVPLHRMATDKILREGDLVFLDLGVCYNGYYSDGTRMVAVGKPNAEQRRLHAVIHEALMRMIDKCRPGNTSLEVGELGRKVIDEAGYGDYRFTGIYGHSVGTSGQEAPVVGDGASSAEMSVELQPGMVLALEPGVFVPGVAGVRCEDVILVTEGDPEVLTRAPYDPKLL